MINVLWAALAALVLLLALFVTMVRFDTGAAESFFIAGLVIAVITWLVCGFITLVVLPSRSVGRTTCRRWAEQTGYQTKFRILNWADTGTCLALAPNGRWVINSQVIINVPSK